MKIRSAKEVIENSKWINSNLIVFDLYSEIMNKSFPVELHFDSQKNEKEVQKETVNSIIEFQNLTKEDIEEIQNAMWEFVIKYKSEDERVYLGIKNKDNAISKSEIAGVGFINEDELGHTFFNIFLNVEWDIERGVTVSYYKGKLDDVG